MMPSTIIRAFKSCGIYPFNPKAVLDYDPFDTLVQKKQNQGLEREPIQNLEQELDSVQMTTDADYVSFSRRHDEGYDLHVYDEHYLAWLILNYSEEVESVQRSDSVAQYFNDVFQYKHHNEGSPSEPNT